MKYLLLILLCSCGQGVSVTAQMYPPPPPDAGMADVGVVDGGTCEDTIIQLWGPDGTVFVSLADLRAGTATIGECFARAER